MAQKWLVVMGVLLLAVQGCTKEEPVLKTENDKVNYSIGVRLARTLKKQGIDVNLDLVERGMRDAFAGKKLILSEDEIQKTMNALQVELRQKQVKQIQTAALDNEKKGEAFLAENKTKEGVVTLASGLQYKILKAGDGKKPTETDTVEVNYKGTLIDGTEFDSSSRRGKPATFQVTGVIPGLKEALQLMPVGSKWQLFIPSKIAYGERGISHVIGPNAVLIFEIELLAIK